jgi:hypothetical protein
LRSEVGIIDHLDVCHVKANKDAKMELTPSKLADMKKVENEMKDEPRAEYDLRGLRVRKLGRGRQSFGDTIRLEPGVAEVFMNADSVNEALRSLISVTSQNQEALKAAKHSVVRSKAETLANVSDKSSH